MSDLHPFAVLGKKHGMIPNNVAAPDSGEADDPVRSFPGNAVTAPHGDIAEVLAQSVSHCLTHAESGAGGSVNLVAVVGFDNFDISGIAHDPGGSIQKLEYQIYPDAEVGGEYYRNGFSGFGNHLLLFIRKPGSAQHHGLVPGGAEGEVA